MTFWAAPLNALFDSLCEGGPPREAEVIFVFAGHPERKRYGIELWRREFAPILALSVARFEWRRFVELGLPDGGLVDLVHETRPEERLFFVVLDRAGARAFRVPKSGLGTWSEARALAEYIHRERIGSVLVVSSAIHLRRAVTTLRGLLRHGRGSHEGGVRIEATAVPEHSIARESWWRASKPRRAVLREAVKLFLYRVRLGLMTLAGR